MFFCISNMRNKGCVRLSVNHIGGVMINLLVSTAVDRGFCTGPTPLHSVLVPHHYTLLVPHHYTLYWFRITTLCTGSASLHSVLVPLLSLFRKGNITSSASLHSVVVPHHYTLYWVHINTLCSGSTSLHSVLVPRHYILYWSQITALCLGST